MGSGEALETGDETPPDVSSNHRPLRRQQSMQYSPWSALYREFRGSTYSLKVTRGPSLARTVFEQRWCWYLLNCSTPRKQGRGGSFLAYAAKCDRIGNQLSQHFFMDSTNLIRLEAKRLGNDGTLLLLSSSILVTATRRRSSHSSPGPRTPWNRGSTFCFQWPQ